MIHQQYLLRTNMAPETPRWVVVRADDKAGGVGVAWFFEEADAKDYIVWKNKQVNPSNPP